MQNTNTKSVTVNTNSKEKAVKHDHSQVKGKAALELFAEVRHLNSACCEARYEYLKKQALSYMNWVKTQPWCTDAVGYCQRVVAEVEKVLDRDTGNGDVRPDLIDTNLQNENRNHQLDGEEEMAASLESLLESNVARAYRKTFGIEGNLRFWEMLLDKATDKLTYLVKQLKKQDEIQDYLDRVVGNKKLIIKAKARIQDLMANNEVEYETFSIFVNLCNQMLTSIDKRERYTVSPGKVDLVPDRIRILEKRIEQYKAKVNEAHMALFEVKETVEPTFEETFQEIVAEGMKLAQHNPKAYEQTLAFIKLYE